MPGEIAVKGIVGAAFLAAIVAGAFGAGEEVQTLCAMLGGIVGTAIIQA